MPDTEKVRIALDNAIDMAFCESSTIVKIPLNLAIKIGYLLEKLEKEMNDNG